MRQQVPRQQAENVFKVHTENGIVEFRANDEGLHTYEPTENYFNCAREQKTNEQKSLLISTVEENKKFHSQHQYERAKEARRLCHIIGRPSLENYKHILRQKIIKNCPVTPEDVDIAEKIFGKDVATLKGKSKNPKPLPVIYTMWKFQEKLRRSTRT